MFGTKILGLTYVPRPGAYAVIRDVHLRIAVLRVGPAIFLPGGGMDAGETAEMTLRREIFEECGRTIQIGAELGRAVEYLQARNEGVCYLIQATFFEAVFLEGQVEPAEKDHELVWVPAREAVETLQRKSQAWAVLTAMEKAG